MADYVEILEGQTNFGWVNTFDLGGKYPAVSKRIWKTYSNMVAFANDYSAEGTCIPGLILTVYNDLDDSKNGVYYVKTVGSEEGEAELIKLGSIPEEVLTQITEQIDAKQDKIIAGNGIELNSDGKTVLIKIDPSSQGLTVGPDGLKAEVPILPEYAITRLSSPESEYSASYQLTKDGEPVGTTIDIPKDMVVQSGSIKTVEEENVPYEGAKVGDLYIDLIIANSTSDHLYIPANKLVDNYTGSTYITVSGEREISLNYDVLKSNINTELVAPISTNVGNLTSKLESLATTVGDGESGLVKDVADLKVNINNKVDKVEDSSLIPNTKLTLIDTNASDIQALKTSVSSKLNNNVTINGQSFVDGTLTLKAIHINIEEAVGPNIAGSSIEDVLSNLDSRITSAVSGGLTSITGGNGIEVSAISGNSQSVSIKKDIKENNTVEVSTSGLYVPDMRSYWEELI